MQSSSSVIGFSNDVAATKRDRLSWRPLPRHEALHEILEAQADVRPEAVALAFGRKEITYADLESRANRLARHLRSLGLGRGSVIAILLPRSPEAYAALLGVLKAGAAYVPIDPEYPRERVAFILDDSRAAALVTTAKLASPYAAFGGAVVRVDTDHTVIAARGSARLPREEVGVGARDLCYIIYTSGSTGRPKGVMIEHRSVCRLVRAEGEIYAARPDDRVYQGASLAFDLSVEEIWLAFQAGAMLVAATPEMERAGPDLSRLLTDSGVTVLSCVPTLLSILAEDVPTLRLLILGGETCPERLVARWTRPGRRIMNTYGPTETTVIATYAELVPGAKVTIGRAVPGYRVYLLDDELQPVKPGEAGEICIGGQGVARGYVGLPDQNSARFVTDPFAPADEPDARIYRTGDHGRFDRNGNLEFLGRTDGQVKLRGFRVELTEIEAALLEADGLLAAACAVREDVPGIQQLVGYVLPHDGAPVDEERLRSHLKSRLPAYMVPALIETVSRLPLLPSGKLDRGALPAPAPRSPHTASRIPAAQLRTATEKRIAEVWEALFRPQPVPLDADFFLDLGGHSLLAARMVSELRKDRRFAYLSVADVYANPTVAALAAALDAAHSSHPSSTAASLASAAEEERYPGERRRHFFAGVIQAIGLYFVFGFRALEWVTPYLLYFLLADSGYSLVESAAWALAGAMVTFPLLVLVAIAAKWLVLGRVRAGRYPLWGAYYLRWWFVRELVSALPLNYLSGTPLLPFIYRLLGVRIGKGVYIGKAHLAAFDLISIGDGTYIDDDATLLGYAVEGGELIVGPLQIGHKCFIGTRAVLREGAAMEDGTRLEDLSLLPRNARIPKGETWAGSPAQRRSHEDARVEPPPAMTPLHKTAVVALYACLLLMLPVVPMSAIVPGMALLIHIDAAAHPWLYLGATPLVGASFVLLLTTEVVVLKRLLVGRVRAGRYPVHGGFYVRNWIVDQLLAISLDIIAPIYATTYVAPWYRALGAKLGQFVELSTALSTTPDLLAIGDGGTVADESSLGAARVEGGWITLAPTRLGRRAFIGNSAVVPAGTVLGDDSLVGVLSIPPADGVQAARTGVTWLGSPPLLLRRREASASFPLEKTFRPSVKDRLIRAAIEVFRVTVPPAGFVMVTATLITIMLRLWRQASTGATLALLPMLYAACCAAVILLVALAKWVVLGRVRPFARPLWTTFIWRLEFVNALYEFLAWPLALDALQGTPFLPWYLRLLGMRIGRRVYVQTAGFVEFDLAEVGDRVALNWECGLQTHLFEDRVLKASRIRIGDNCDIGTLSIALYDSTMESGARLDALSLLMKGETLPAGTAWAGIPAVCQRENHERWMCASG